MANYYCFSSLLPTFRAFVLLKEMNKSGNWALFQFRIIPNHKSLSSRTNHCYVKYLDEIKNKLPGHLYLLKIEVHY